MGAAARRRAAWGPAGGTYARQRTDQPDGLVQARSLVQERNMSSALIETGWQRFLDRLKQLWGKSRNSDLPTTAIGTGAAEGPGAACATAETPAPKPGAV